MINLSDSPYHLLTRSDDDTEKNVELTSAAKHYAINVLPVPGVPYNKIFRAGFLSFEKRFGNFLGKTTASKSNYLIFYKPATSANVVVGFSIKIHYLIASYKAFDSLSLSLLPPP